jgi:hypothetical protein
MRARSGPFADTSARRYWAGVGVYVVVLLTIQSVMGFGIDKFKELWGEGALEVVAYAFVAAGASGMVWTGWRVWSRCSVAERVWIGIGVLVYGAGTLSARYPQERLHYLGYGLLAALLYFGFARDREARLGASHLPRGAESSAADTGTAWLPAAMTLLAGSLIGYGDELLQILWPRRYFDWADVAMNVAAVGLGVLVAIPVWRALKRS